MSILKINIFPLIITIYFFLPLTSIGQVENIKNEKLENYLSIWNNEEKEDSIRFQAVFKALNILISEKKYKSSNTFCDEVLEIAEKKGYKNYLARAILFKSVILFGCGREKESLEKIQKSLEICKGIDDKIGIARAYSRIGNNHYYVEEYQKGINAFEKSLNLFKIYNDTVNQIYSLKNISYGLRLQKKIDSSFLILKSTLELSKNHSKNFNLSSLLKDMSHLMLFKGFSIFEGLTSYDYGKKGEITNVKYGENNQNIDYLNSQIKKYYDSAMFYLNESYEIDLKKKNVIGQYNYYKSYANILKQRTSLNWVLKEYLLYAKNNRTVLKYCQKAIDLAHQSNIKNLREDPVPYYGKYFSQKQIGWITFGTARKALRNFEFYHRLSDSLKKQNNAKELVRLLSEQEFDIKKQTDSLRFTEKIKLQKAETRVKEEEIKAQRAETRAKEEEIKLQFAKNIAKDKEIKAQRAETRAKEEEIKAQRAETRAKEEEIKAQRAETRAKEEEIKVQIAENKARVEENRAKEEEIKNQKIIEGVLFAGIILVIGFLMFVYKQLNNTKKQKLVIEDKQKEISDSIVYAKRIQTAILPSSKIVKQNLKDSFIYYLPKDIVAGDFYWMEKVGKKTLFAAADCTGHGVPGAMVSVICNSCLNKSVLEFNLTDPGEILDKTRELVLKEFEKSEEEINDGMDIAICSLEEKKESYELKFAGAYNPLWLIRGGVINDVKGNRQPIGKSEKKDNFKTEIFQLNKGDSFYIFSDGYVDQFGGEKGKKYKSAQFKKFLLSINYNPMEKQKELIAQNFDQWKGNYEQIDDVCVIGVKV